jgi:hypothetical protein
VLWSGVNAIEIEQLVTYSNLIIGESSGAADQEFQLPATSVEPETFVLEVEEEGRWDPWSRVDDLATLDPNADQRINLDAARDARAFQLDAFAGRCSWRRRPRPDSRGTSHPGAPASLRRRRRRKPSRGDAQGHLRHDADGRSAGSRLVVAQPMALGAAPMRKRFVKPNAGFRRD